MKLKNAVYNIKNIACKTFYVIKNNAGKVVTGATIVVMPFVFNSCGKHEMESQEGHKTFQKEYVSGDLRNLDSFKDVVRHEVVNKNKGKTVLIKFTKDSKEMALKEITVEDWDKIYEPAFQEMEALAKQHNKQLLFNDTLEVEYIDLDEFTQGHLLGVGGGKDLTGPTYLDLKRMGIYFLPRHGKKSCR
jgi:hypothetical protein